MAGPPAPFSVSWPPASWSSAHSLDGRLTALTRCSSSVSSRIAGSQSPRSAKHSGHLDSSARCLSKRRSYSSTWAIRRCRPDYASCNRRHAGPCRRLLAVLRSPHRRQVHRRRGPRVDRRRSLAGLDSVNGHDHVRPGRTRPAVARSRRRPLATHGNELGGRLAPSGRFRDWFGEQCRALQVVARSASP